MEVEAVTMAELVLNILKSRRTKEYKKKKKVQQDFSGSQKVVVEKKVATSLDQVWC